MTIDLETLIEAYSVLKEYVPSKDRQGAADTFMSVMIDLLSDEDAKELAGVDAYLKRSYAEYSTEDEELEDDLDYDE